MTSVFLPQACILTARSTLKIGGWSCWFLRSLIFSRHACRRFIERIPFSMVSATLLPLNSLGIYRLFPHYYHPKRSCITASLHEVCQPHDLVGETSTIREYSRGALESVFLPESYPAPPDLEVRRSGIMVATKVGFGQLALVLPT